MKENKSLFKKPLFLLAVWILFLIILTILSKYLENRFTGFILLSFLVTPFLVIGLSFWAFFRGVKQIKNKDKLYGILNVFSSILLILTSLFLIKFYILFPFGNPCSKGLECFPSGGFSEDYINCGIINPYYSNDNISDIKSCILNSKDNCINAYARIDYYGVEGQTGVSKFIVVEKDQSGCSTKYYTSDGNNKIEESEQICNLIKDSSENICEGIK